MIFGTLNLLVAFIAFNKCASADQENNEEAVAPDAEFQPALQTNHTSYDNEKRPMRVWYAFSSQASLVQSITNDYLRALLDYYEVVNNKDYKYKLLNYDFEKAIKAASHDLNRDPQNVELRSKHFYAFCTIITLLESIFDTIEKLTPQLERILYEEENQSNKLIIEHKVVAIFYNIASTINDITWRGESILRDHCIRIFIDTVTYFKIIPLDDKLLSLNCRKKMYAEYAELTRDDFYSQFVIDTPVPALLEINSQANGMEEWKLMDKWHACLREEIWKLIESEVIEENKFNKELEASLRQSLEHIKNKLFNPAPIILEESSSSEDVEDLSHINPAFKKEKRRKKLRTPFDVKNYRDEFDTTLKAHCNISYANEILVKVQNYSSIEDMRKLATEYTQLSKTCPGYKNDKDYISAVKTFNEEHQCIKDRASSIPVAIVEVEEIVNSLKGMWETKIHADNYEALREQAMIKLEKLVDFAVEIIKTYNKLDNKIKGVTNELKDEISKIRTFINSLPGGQRRSPRKDVDPAEKSKNSNGKPKGSKADDTLLTDDNISGGADSCPQENYPPGDDDSFKLPIPQADDIIEKDDIPVDDDGSKKDNIPLPDNSKTQKSPGNFLYDYVANNKGIVALGSIFTIGIIALGFYLLLGRGKRDDASI
ncbi:hypothetical protein ENBRE01_2851 [Enteropsectra breve]|nr:hypothetical protein ENBRE01_2851 [Enteropsectra breve]